MKIRSLIIAGGLAFSMILGLPNIIVPVIECKSCLVSESSSPAGELSRLENRGATTAGSRDYRVYRREEHTLVVTVKPGDTLWDLAAAYGPPGEDIRDTVDRIREQNRLANAMLFPGQQIIISR